VNDSSRHNGFVPLLLIALSLILILTWELVTGSQARANGRQLREQQSKLVDQSKQIQTGLEKLARDLINVAGTDPDAKAIVTKYQINISNPNPAPTASASPSP
jgi:hypothetical protein